MTDPLTGARPRPFAYLKPVKPDAPLSDNPSGLFCRACRAIGFYHCAYPEECGNMERMKPHQEVAHER